MRPRRSGSIHTRESWLRRIDSFDRQVRRSNKRHRETVVFLDAQVTSLIYADRSVPGTRLNRLTIGSDKKDENPWPKLID
jgi:hypothetical protein